MIFLAVFTQLGVPKRIISYNHSVIVFVIINRENHYSVKTFIPFYFVISGLYITIEISIYNKRPYQISVSPYNFDTQNMNSAVKETHHKAKRHPKQSLLLRAFQGLLLVLRKKMHGTATVRSTEIIKASHIPTRTFMRNFRDVDEIIRYCYEEIADVFEDISFTPDKAPTYDIFFERILRQIRLHDDALRVMLDRADNSDWRDIMISLKPVIIYKWEGRFSKQAADWMFYSFVSEFADLLGKWADLDFSSDYIKSYVATLKKIRSMIETEGAERGALLATQQSG